MKDNNEKLNDKELERLASIPSSGDSTAPNVEPIKNIGTTSPPLKPTESEMAVNIIFNINAYGTTFPFIALFTMFIPAPL